MGSLIYEYDCNVLDCNVEHEIHRHKIGRIIKYCVHVRTQCPSCQLTEIVIWHLYFNQLTKLNIQFLQDVFKQYLIWEIGKIQNLNLLKHLEVLHTEIEYNNMLHFWRFLSIENLVGYFELFWRHIYINAPNTAWRYIDRSLQALQTLYWPLKFSGSKVHRFEIMTGTWRYVRRYSWRPDNLLVLRLP